MSQPLTAPQLAELEADLRALHAELTHLLEISKDGSKPVDLDEPIGRISRMDAIQQQKMAQSNRRSNETRRQRVHSALANLATGEYGDCRECDEPIGYRRLKARPESSLCLPCQSAREGRR